MGKIIRGKFGNGKKSPVKKIVSSKRETPVLRFDFRFNAFLRDRAARTHLWTHRVEKYGLRADTGFHTRLLYELEPKMIDHAVAALQNLPPRLFIWEKLSEDQRFACVVGANVIHSNSILDFVRRLNNYQRGVMMIIDAIRKDGELAVLRNTRLCQRAERIMRNAAGSDVNV